jgi:hypothetical protein
VLVIVRCLLFAAFSIQIKHRNRYYHSTGANSDFENAGHRRKSWFGQEISETDQAHWGRKNA